jgi:site-specific recombinase XerD
MVGAKRAFLEHLKKRQVSSATILKFEILLSMLESFAHDRPLAAIDTPIVERFRNTRNWSALTTAKYIERLRRFWKFAIRQKWAAENPAPDLELPRVPKQVAPLEPEELKRSAKKRQSIRGITRWRSCFAILV